MRFYRVICGNTTMFAPTRADAHKLAKGITDRFNVEVHEIEVPTDRDAVFALLVNDPAELEFKVLRKWGLTDRGGLSEEITP